MKSNTDIFETKYAHMKDNPKLTYFHKLNQIRFDILKQYVSMGRSLDLGCGNGIHLIPLVKQGYNIEGLDNSKHLLNDLQQQCKEPIKLYKADIQNIPCENERFDFVYSISTLCYVSDQQKAIKEIYRILNPGGIAYLEFGNRNSLNHFESKRVSTGIVSNHINYNWLTQYLKKTGFNIFHERFFQISPLWGSIVPRSLAPIMTTSYIHKGYECMIDEAIASSTFMQKYAFRLCVFLSKGPHDVIQNLAVQTGDVKQWTSEYRNKIWSNFVTKNIGEQLQILYDLFREDPTDPLAFYYMARLHVQTEAERYFTESIKQDINRYIEKCS